MKRLGLLRHAKSDWDDIGQRDFDRGLNDRGRKGARLIGEHIAAHGVPFDLVLASPAERVKATLIEAMPDKPVRYDPRIYLADVETLLERVGRKDNRPLLKQGNPREILTRLAAERAPFYAEAPIRVVSENGPHADTARAIIEAIDQWL